MARRGKKRSGRCTRRNRQNRDTEDSEPKEFTKAPHSFVMQRGFVGPYVRELIRDFRNVMKPFTATSLRVTRKNSLKDFVSVAGMFHVTHFCIFTRTDLGAYMRIARVPRGPTLSFRVHNYTLTRDIISHKKKHAVSSRQFEHHPLVVLNGFTGEGSHMKIMATTFQNMFPTINLIKVDLSSVRRCVLLNYDPVSKLIDFRHYAVKVVPAGVSRSVKKIVQSKVPNLARYKDVSEYITNPAQLSESEAEDDPASHVVLPQQLSSRGNLASNVSAIRLVEIGPRLTLELLKMEDNFCSGDVLYHKYVTKTEEEIKLTKKKLQQKSDLKARRKREQQQNTKKKELQKQMLKERSIKGMKMKFGQNITDGDSNQQNVNGGDDNTAGDSDNNEEDAAWYKEEVGEEPDQDLFAVDSSGSVKRKRPMSDFTPYRKRLKKSIPGILKNPQKSKQSREKNKNVKFEAHKKGFVSKKHKRAHNRNK